MKRNYLGVIILTLLGLTGTIAFAAQSRVANSFIDFLSAGLVGSTAAETEIPSLASKEPAPRSSVDTDRGDIDSDDETRPGKSENGNKLINYYVVFKFADFLEKEARKAEKSGEDPTEYRQYFKNRANLDAAQAEIFRQIAAECVNDVAATDAQAEEVIRRDRENLKKIDATTIGGAPLPELPELQRLQKKRDETIERHIERLKIRFGEESFIRFEKYVRSKVAPKVQVVPAKTRETAVNEKEEVR